MAFGGDSKGGYRAPRVMLRLLRWLGPWNDGVTPRGIARVERDLGDGHRTLRFTGPGRPRGAYVVVPGMHPDGAADPRLDRFCRVLAAAGFVVDAPLLREHLRLRLHPDTPSHLARALLPFADEVRAMGLPPPALFSVSFGSLPAIQVAAAHPDAISGLLLFGGFADLDATIRHAVTGEGGAAAPDPLNTPAIFLNLLPHLGAGEHEPLLEWAWLTMVRRTWGRPELKLPGARAPIAGELADTLPPAARELFLTGCGLAPGAAAALDRALPFVATAHADPRPHLARLARPVAIAHGRGDDVIPVAEAAKIEAALPPSLPRRTLVTGMYGHTGAERIDPRAAAGEIATLLGLVRALDALPRGALD